MFTKILNLLLTVVVSAVIAFVVGLIVWLIASIIGFNINPIRMSLAIFICWWIYAGYRWLKEMLIRALLYTKKYEPIAIASGCSSGALIRMNLKAFATNPDHKDIVDSCPTDGWTNLSVVFWITRHMLAFGKTATSNKGNIALPSRLSTGESAETFYQSLGFTMIEREENYFLLKIPTEGVSIALPEMVIMHNNVIKTNGVTLLPNLENVYGLELSIPMYVFDRQTNK